jgi:hypothetical protein
MKATVSLKRRYLLIILHGITFQKTLILGFSAVRSSYLMYTENFGEQIPEIRKNTLRNMWFCHGVTSLMKNAETSVVIKM